MRYTYWLAAVAVAVAGNTAAAQVVYENTTNFLMQASANGGATTAAGNTITRLVADDITLATSATNIEVGSFTFSVANFDAGPVTARARVRFYNNDGAGNGPGTLVGGFTFNPIAFNPGVGLFTFNPAAGQLVLPDNTFWAGITFDDNTGATGATPAQLNNLGQGLFDPPGVGTSGNVAFATTDAGSFLVNNPVGSPIDFGAGGPVANFGWGFTAVPEPTGLLAVAAAAAGGVLARRRRRAA